MSIDIKQVTGLILAGGRATRMGGVDKGLQPLRGEPMAAWVMRRMQPQVGALLINANRHRADYEALGAPVCADVIEGFAGPLAGIHAGLAACTTDYLATAPCDSPLLPADLVQQLAGALVREQAEAAVAVTTSNAQRQRHPVFLLLKASLLPALADFVARGGRRVDDWLATLCCAEAAFDDESAFANVNTREELDALERKA